MERLLRRTVPALSLLGACLALPIGSAHAAPPFTLITTGFDIQGAVRPALAEDGTVVAAESEALIVGDGLTASVIDLVPTGLEINPGNAAARAIQVRSEGDIVFAADHALAPGCAPYGARGVYRTDKGGAPPVSLFAPCITGPSAVEKVGPHVSMSLSGTVAFSSIVSSAGAIHRGPVAGPVPILRSGTGTFYNTGEIVVNDGGQVAAQMEYSDPYAGLVRGILIFETPEQDLVDIDTAIERVGFQPPIAINSSGLIAFSSNFDFSMNIDGTIYNFTKGVYTADPTLFYSEKMLTQIADVTGNYCGFGRVDINDAGTVVFEAQLDDGLSGCAPGFNATHDGIFMGADPVADEIVSFGDEALEAHQFFDDIRLGELNDNDQVSFLTTYSEPLVEPIYVWRAELDELENQSFIQYIIERWREFFLRLLERLGFLA